MLNKEAIIASLTAIRLLEGKTDPVVISDEDWAKIELVFKYHPAISGEYDLVRVLSMNNAMTIIDGMYKTAQELQRLDQERDAIIEKRNSLKRQIDGLDRMQRTIEERTNQIWRGSVRK